MSGILNKIHLAIEEDEEENVLKHSNEYLFYKGDDAEIQKCNLIAMIKVGKFEEAMKLKQQNKAELNPEEEKFLQGYLNYKRGAFNKATEGLTMSQSLRARYLRAQALYK